MSNDLHPLPNDRVGSLYRAAMSANEVGVGLVSIGYEGRTQDDLVQVLVSAGVTMLVDVRLTPLSRKPGLSRRGLEAALATVGIAYRHERALGNPKDNRAPFRDGNLRVGRKAFAAILKRQDAAAAVAGLAEDCQRERVAVLCFERDHDRCHRQLVVEATLDRIPGRHEVAYA
jgi:uncharacterized protein (DUF488 family)